MSSHDCCTVRRSSQTNGEFLKKRLYTMMNTVRGSNQYWYRRSEVKCMIAEFGSPTFFLTFSCAEYSFEDITEYLHKVNTVLPS
uniref:Helitron helicase-like domain-containing protein n=1 Tax=Amphimedon queenslandica TaxID=400682 RepID=A0A1X7V5V9_AMPQE